VGLMDGGIGFACFLLKIYDTRITQWFYNFGAKCSDEFSTSCFIFCVPLVIIDESFQRTIYLHWNIFRLLLRLFCCCCL